MAASAAMLLVGCSIEPEEELAGDVEYIGEDSEE